MNIRQHPCDNIHIREQAPDFSNKLTKRTTVFACNKPFPVYLPHQYHLLRIRIATFLQISPHRCNRRQFKTVNNTYSTEQ